eukprot:12928664-Prorocentrum_lima.AAC.1
MIQATINAETEELKNACSRAAMVLQNHGLLTCSLLADQGESIDQVTHDSKLHDAHLISPVQELD